jgi:hypothetical protein
MSSDLIAIDVALLLPDEANARAEAVNAKLYEPSEEGFQFDDTHLPHLTLVQQFCTQTHLPLIHDAVNAVLNGRRSLVLRVSGIKALTTSVQFAVEPTLELQQLHEDLMDALAPLAEPSGDENAFVHQDEPPRLRDVEWVTNFRAQASFENYSPHITLGKGERPETVEPFSFTANRLAVCRLGRFCTCRVVLREWRLMPIADCGLRIAD